MGARGPAGGADVTDHIALAHFLTFFQARSEAAHVGVGGGVVGPVFQDNNIAVAVLAADGIDHAVARGADRRACCCGEIDALVRFPVAGNRVHAHGEAGRDAGKFEGGFQEGFFEGLAVETVVTAALLAGWVFEPNGLVSRAAVGEFTGQDAARSDKFAILPECFVDNIKRVAAFQVGAEVDIGGEHFHDLRGNRVWQAGAVQAGVGGGEQGGSNLARVHFNAAFQLGCHFRGHELVALAGDQDVLDRFVRAIDEGGAHPVEVAVFGRLRLHALARFQQHHAARDLVGFDEIGGRRIIHAETGQQGGEGIAGADFFFVGEILVYLFHRGNLRGDIRHFQILGDRRDRQVGCVRRHGRHSDRAEGGHGEQHRRRANNACLACRRQLCVQA